MGKYSVSLHHRHPRLVLESFEDRALLSSGRGLTALSPHWLTENLLTRSLESQPVAVVSSEANLTASKVEGMPISSETNLTSSKTAETTTNVQQTAEDAANSILAERIEKELRSREEVAHSETNAEDARQEHEDTGQTPEETSSESSEQTEENANEVSTTDESVSDESGDPVATDSWNEAGTNLSDLGEEAQETEWMVRDHSNNNTNREAIGENGTQDKSGTNFTEVKERLKSILREKVEATDEEVPLPAVLQNSPLPDPVIVHVLRNYANDQRGGDSESPSDRGRVLPSTESDSPSFAGEHSSHHDSRDSAPDRSQVNLSPNPPSQESRVDGGTPKQTSVVSPANHDVGHVSPATPVGPSPRSDVQGVETRGMDQHQQAAVLVRQGADAGAVVRNQEAPDVRQAGPRPTTAGDPAPAASSRPEGTVRSALGSTGPTLHATDGVAPAECVAQGNEESNAEAPAAAEPQPALSPWAIFAPHAAGLLEGIVPYDHHAMQIAVQQLFAQVEDLGGDAAAWLAQMNLSPWVVGIAVGLTACDVVRRRQQQAQRGLMLTDADGTPLTWFPGLAGVWTMQDA